VAKPKDSKDDKRDPLRGVNDGRTLGERLKRIRDEYVERKRGK